MNFKVGDIVKVIDSGRPLFQGLPLGSIHKVTEVINWSLTDIRLKLEDCPDNPFFHDRFKLINSIKIILPLP